MKNYLHRKLLVVKKQYKEFLPSIDNYLSTQQATSTEDSAGSHKGAQEYLQNTSLKKKLDTLLSQLDAELSKNETEISYATFMEKLTTADQLLHELHEKTKSTWKKIIDSFWVQLAFVFFIKAFVIGWYCVPTGSAEPNLLVGDRLIANKTAYWFSDVKRGDLAVFDNPEVPYSSNWIKYLWQRFVGVKIGFLGLPEGPDNFVKRVVGIPGDIIEGRIEDGHPVLYRNGKKLDEPWVNPYPLIAVQKMNGFFPASNPIMRFFGKLRNSPVLCAGIGLTAAALWYITNPADILPELGLELTAAVVGFAAAYVPHIVRFLEIRKSENCKGHPSFYTFDPEKSLDEQPFYKIEEKEICKSPFTGKPLFRRAGEPEHYDTFMKMRLPEGKYWLQGDSRRNSHDCRVWGPVDRSLIRGKASIIMYSINSEEVWWLFDILKNPLSFWSKKLRPERAFTILKNPLPKSEQG
ncbi:signal peptidase I [Candidatus Dependentiae bacterium]|nr:signal peptidase I [Candidatus Dependentiae bacterium]